MGGVGEDGVLMIQQRGVCGEVIQDTSSNYHRVAKWFGFDLRSMETRGRF